LLRDTILYDLVWGRVLRFFLPARRAGAASALTSSFRFMPTDTKKLSLLLTVNDRLLHRSAVINIREGSYRQKGKITISHVNNTL
jgi:hypothetical protein